ncbi:MAG TPA: hypothetical protein VGD67_03125 [Pseudonocardiaceae bacterium]
MYATIVLWNLSRSEQTAASLRAYLRDYAVDAYAAVEGLRQKVWVSSTGPEGEEWGAIYLWESEELAYGRPPGVSRVVELIGYRPTRRMYFSVEAAVDGPAGGPALAAGLGLAFEDPAAQPMRRPQEFVPPSPGVIRPG